MLCGMDRSGAVLQMPLQKSCRRRLAFRDSRSNFFLRWRFRCSTWLLLNGINQRIDGAVAASNRGVGVVVLLLLLLSFLLFLLGLLLYLVRLFLLLLCILEVLIGILKLFLRFH